MILLAESGSTKTSWIGISKNNITFETKGINPYYQSESEISELLKPHFAHHLNAAVHQVYYYGTGITDVQKEQVVQRAVQNALGYSVPVEAHSDVIAAARSLFGDKAGIACILGTGSNSCFWDGKKIDGQIPPLGFWLGDEGSGGYLGKSLVLSYLHEKMPTDIRSKFIEKYTALGRLDILQKAYKDPKPNTYFASFATFCAEYREHPYIQGLINANFEQFYDLYLARYPMLIACNLGFVGSIAYYFKENLEKVIYGHTQKTIHVIQRPIDGLLKYHQE